MRSEGVLILGALVYRSMGGHGGLNILPQKRWNVYNYDNREKVRLDEEAAARDEQLKRDDARKRDTELRLEKLRQARGLASASSNQAPKPSSPESRSETRLEKDSDHINLFEGIRIFDPIEEKAESKDQRPIKKVKKEQPPRVVTGEDEKYKLGYGIVGKGTKLPWYMEKPANKSVEKSDDDDDDDLMPSKKKSSNGKKTVEELRKERLEREKREKERQRALLTEKSRRDGGFSLRR